MDAGALVQNVGTTYALAQAIVYGKPLVERVVTVTGTPLKESYNLKVRIGTLFSELLSYCGVEDKVGKLISGGPMMGIAQSSAEVPVLKGTSGILVLSPEEAGALPERACIRCGRCVDACPIGLLPTLLDQYCRNDMWHQAEEGHMADVLRLSCYAKPPKRQLVAEFRLGKAEVLARRCGYVELGTNQNILSGKESCWCFPPTLGRGDGGWAYVAGGGLASSQVSLLFGCPCTLWSGVASAMVTE